MRIKRNWSISAGFVLAVAAVVLSFSGCSSNSDQASTPVEPNYQSVPLGKQAPGIQRAIEVQNKYNASLMRLNDVVGVGTGLDAEGAPAIIVFTKTGANHNLPTVLEGTPVQQDVIGEVVAYQYNPNAKGGNSGGGSGSGGHGGHGGGGSTINPAGRFTRPVPIGVSTGNINECASGTISCRVKDANGNFYALSNNHVFARENAASLGESEVQPGRYDVSCAVNNADIIGTLTAFKPIVFSSTANNDIDAAIMAIANNSVGNATPSNGYGQPNHITTSASVGQAVQKYGRTTGQTYGTVSAINATITVGYTYGNAQFTGQIVIASSSRKSKFSAAGDSGSLIVTNDAAANPVALLFAGSSTTTIANPIDPVLSYFHVTIDGK